MENREGLTLVEVILAIAILGIISLVFLSSMANHYSFLSKTKDITKNAFLSQRAMEEKIDSVKKGIRKQDGSVPLTEDTILKNLDSNGVKIKYHEISEEYHGRKYYTLVSDIKPGIYESIKLDPHIENKIKHKSNTVPYGYSSNDFKIEGSFKNHKDYRWDHLLNVVEWYAASSDYIIPIPDELTLGDEEYYYPQFPGDYLLVENESIPTYGSHTVRFEELEEYKGRHIVFTATPGAKSGRIGEQLISKPVFISGLPVTKNLRMHFDAGFINPFNSEEVINPVEDEKRVVKWFELSSIYGNKSPNKFAANTDYAGAPSFKQTKEDDGFKGQYVNFKDNELMKISNNINFGKNLHLFAYVRNKSKTEQNIFIKNGENEFYLAPNTQEENNGWQLIDKVFISEELPYEIGNSEVDIAEIIIYEGVATEETRNEIMKYFIDKY